MSTGPAFAYVSRPSTAICGPRRQPPCSCRIHDRLGFTTRGNPTEYCSANQVVEALNGDRPGQRNVEALCEVVCEFFVDGDLKGVLRRERKAYPAFELSAPLAKSLYCTVVRSDH